jgi:hypothetical protein
MAEKERQDREGSRENAHGRRDEHHPNPHD